MTTLAMPSFQLRLISAVAEEMKAVQEQVAEDSQFLADLLRRIREYDVQVRQKLEELLVNGVEARSFVRDYGPLLAATESQIATFQSLGEKHAHEGSQSFQNLMTETRLLLDEKRSFRDFLAEALARASEKPRPVDLQRIRSAEEAYARGETKPFSRR
jgi:hypothetical protein